MVFDEVNHFLQFDGYKLEQLANKKLVMRDVGDPDWESGSVASFSLELKNLSNEFFDSLGEEFFAELAIEMEQLHSQEPGMKEEFYDLARQRWLAEFLSHTISKTIAKSTGPIVENVGLDQTKITSQQTIVTQIDTLIIALKENLDATEHRTNERPVLDLALHEDDVMAVEVRRLTEILGIIKTDLAKSSAENSDISIGNVALREFVLKLAGSTGEGIGKSITWGTRMALVYFAIAIIRDLGFPVEDLTAFVEKILPRP